MKLLLINPNTSDTMTVGIAQSAQAVAAASTQIIAVHPTFGPLSIEGHYDEAFAAAGVAEQVRLAQAQSPDAIVLGCAGMSALCHTLTERLGVPVIDGVAVA